MQPKKVKQLLPDVATQLYMQLELVEAVSKFFWVTTRKALAEAPKLSIHLPNLGDFEIKHWKLNDELASAERSLATINCNERPNQHTVKTMTEKVSLLQRLVRMKVGEDQRKEFIKKHKKERKQNVETIISANLEQ
jgi:hypothetical protein